MLKQFRTSRGLTQKQMAEYIGVARTTYQSWETGRRNPSKENMLYIQGCLNRIKSYELADSYYKAITRVEKKSSFLSKRKLLKLLVMIIIVLILVVLY